MLCRNEPSVRPFLSSLLGHFPLNRSSFFHFVLRPFRRIMFCFAEDADWTKARKNGPSVRLPGMSSMVFVSAFSNGCIMYHLRYFWRIKETRLLLTLVAFINYFRRQNAINATKVWRSEPWGKGRLSNSQGGFLQVGSLKGSDDELKEKGIHGVETNEIYLS